MSSPVKYALWLRPFGEIAFKLRQQIHQLSEKYSSPAFEPHITLLGGLTQSEVELQQMTNVLAASLHPFDVVLTKAGYKDTYFQSLFVRVQQNKELINARKTAEQMFNAGSEEPYEPHLSLMYGNFSRQQKERILNTVGREFHLRFKVHNLLLIKTQGEPEMWNKSLSVEFKPS